MHSRRQFLKNAALLSGAMGLWSVLDAPIKAAADIAPQPGSTFYDAEHIVILMQENRSFDHCFGTLAGVRGFNDPRAIRLANGNPVWTQSNHRGETFAPFRLNLLDSRSTWMGSLPHTWDSQVDARNEGQYDRWLSAKATHIHHYGLIPLTMGYYNRQDIPFYYGLADAFTVCDQHFCSALTATYPNRMYFWTGTLREQQTAASPPAVRPEQVVLNGWNDLTCFPERLQRLGVSWKIYQNDLAVPSGLGDEQEAWLSNFGCNMLEYFERFGAKFSPDHLAFVQQQLRDLPAEIDGLSRKLAATTQPAELVDALQARLTLVKRWLARAQEDSQKYTPENFAKLTAEQLAIRERAFTTNAGDPDYRQIVEVETDTPTGKQRMVLPKGDVLHQFRQDVQQGKLPTVSWLVAPERLSDHPESPFYGAWFTSEAFRILVENPAVWRKTVFILTYDENDGYFDHVPPFVAPDPARPETGRTSKSVDPSLDYVSLELDKASGYPGPRESPIGLGYRVPMIIASPWSRGGRVCSQVLDSTSILQFLEKFVSRKTGQSIQETNISSWRRAVCGDLTSAFQGEADLKQVDPGFLARDKYVEQINEAQWKPLPSGYKPLAPEEISQIATNPAASPYMPQQEPGVRPSCPLPYQLHVDSVLDPGGMHLTIRMAAVTERFGNRTAGAPFTLYARAGSQMAVRNYAVAAGEQVEDSWQLKPGGHYQLEVHGPNGFLREYEGAAGDGGFDVTARYGSTGDLVLAINNQRKDAVSFRITDRSYRLPAMDQMLAAGTNTTLRIDTQKSFHWYDLVVELTGDQSTPFRRGFAGRVETGEWGYSDPAMGRVVS